MNAVKEQKTKWFLKLEEKHFLKFYAANFDEIARDFSQSSARQDYIS